MLPNLQAGAAGLKNKFFCALAIISTAAIATSCSQKAQVRESLPVSSQGESSFDAFKEGLNYLREHPSTREDERIQRFLYLDRWARVLQDKNRMTPDLAQELWTDLTAQVKDEPAMSVAGIEKALSSAQTKLGRNVASFELYHQLLKEKTPEEAVKALDAVEDDGTSDIYKRAQEILQLNKDNKGGGHGARVGVLVPLSGELQTFGQEVLQAIHIVSQLAYADGVEFVVEDIGSTQEQLLKAWDKLALQEKVTAIIGPLTPKETEMVFERAEVAQVPVISLAPKEDLQTFGQYGFRSTLTIEDQMRKIADFIQKDLHAKTVGILMPDNAYGWDSIEIGMKEFKDHDLEVKQLQVYPANATDFKEQLKRMTRLDFPRLRKDEICPRKGPAPEGCVKKVGDLKPIVDFQVLVVPDSADTVGLMLPTLPYLRIYGVQVVGLSVYNSKKLLDRGGDSAEGVIFTDGYLASAKNFATRFFRDQYIKLSKKEPTRIAAEAFDVAMLTVHIMKNAEGTLTRQKFKEYLQGMRDFPGVTGVMSTENQKIRKDPKLIVVRDQTFQELRLGN